MTPDATAYERFGFPVARSLSVERRGSADFEVQHLRVPHTASRNAVRRLLTDEAEYGGWELERLRRHRNGVRDVWLKRRIIKARSTLEL